MSTSSRLSLEVDQLIDARPATVFRLLTEPDLYVQWFGPEGSAVTVEEMEIALGGRLELRIKLPGSDFEVGIEGFYEVIEPPTRLVHTWRSLDEELVTTVSFELEPQGDQTRLRVQHRGFADPLQLSQNRTGWQDHLGVLALKAAALGDRQPGSD